MKWALMGTLAAVLAVAAVASADFAMQLPGAGATIEAMYAEGNTLYVARSDGVVQALDRTNETVRWSHDLGPGTRALDLVSEAGPYLYVATSTLGNGAGDPILAIAKTDGHVVWRSTEAYAVAGKPHFLGPVAQPLERDADAYRLALDTGRASNNLWAGLEHGFVVMLDKTTGGPVLKPNGDPRILVPTDRDRLTPLAGNPCLRPSGIYALAVHDNQLWAARNFGGVDKQGKCANPLLTSLFNDLYRLEADRLVDDLGRPAGNDTLQFPLSLRADPIDPANCVCPDGRRFAIPSILDLWVDPAQSTPTQQTLYLTGAWTGKVGVVMGLRATGLPTATAPFPTAFALTDFFEDEDSEFGAPPPVPVTTVPLGEAAIASAVRGDATHVYVTTWQNKTSGMKNVPAGGFVAKFPLTLGTAVDWVYTTAVGGGDPNPVRGRSWEAGDANALVVEPGTSGKVLVGHGAIVPPYPGPGRAHTMGALVVETPKGRGPVPVLMLPAAGDFLNGQAPLAFRTDFPRDDAQSLISAELQYMVMPSGAWTKVANLNIAQSSGNDYSITNNVPLDNLPESDSLRLRVVVRGASGEVGTDRTDGLVTVDRTAPQITAFGVTTDGVDVKHSADSRKNPVLRTDQPSFFVRGNDTLSDIDTTASYLWIDDPSHKYPFLSFVEQDGYYRGFRFDMAGGHAYGSLPAHLAPGPHVVHAEIIDFAGNYDFEQWTIHVDTGVEAPRFLPLDGTWVGDARPQWSAQFGENVSAVEVRIDNVVQASGFQVFPQHAAQNPDGARIVVRPGSDRADGATVRYNVTVRDTAGNVAGPFSSTVRVDRSGPALSVPVPAANALLPDGRPVISLQVQDNRSGLALSGLRLWLDGALQPTARYEGDRITFQPASRLVTGVHTVKVDALDLAGNTATRTWTFTIDTDSPAVTLSAILPAGQTAAKRGDQVRLEALVQGDVTNVTFDARAINDAAKALKGNSDGNGRFWVVVNVTDAPSGDLQVLATAVDRADHKGTGQAAVRIDNRPPVTFMLELPAKVANAFVLRWAQDGDDDAARFILESQVDDGAWRVLDAGLTGTTYTYAPLGGDEVTLRFRVSAVDGAGNVQSHPSNAVETRLVASPIDALLMPSTWPVKGPVAISLTPVAAAKLRAVHAELTLPDGTVLERDLTVAGNLFRTSWNLTVTQGTGQLDLLMEDESGSIVRATYPVAFGTPPAPLVPNLEDDGKAKDSPNVSIVLVALAILAVAVSRRRAH